jgi:hypothetical protein
MKHSILVVSSLVLQAFSLQSTIREGLEDIVEGTGEIVTAPIPRREVREVYEETPEERRERKRWEEREERKREQEERRIERVERRKKRVKRVEPEARRVRYYEDDDNGYISGTVKRAGRGAGRVVRGAGEIVAAPFDDDYNHD